MSQFNLQQVADGDFQLSGDITLQTVMALKNQSKSLFAGVSKLQFDLSGVAKVDSAALALVLDWINQAQKQDKTISFTNFPAHLHEIAVAYGIEKDLPIH